MTWPLGILITAGSVLAVFCLGVAVGGHIAYRQLERDTHGWTHPPFHR